MECLCSALDMPFPYPPTPSFSVDLHSNLTGKPLFFLVPIQRPRVEKKIPLGANSSTNGDRTMVIYCCCACLESFRRSGTGGRF